MDGNPFRACFNFQDTCTLACSFCYIPFGKGRFNRDLAIDVINRLADLGINVITFGGGDPFQYRDCQILFQLAKQLNFFVQVDTNGLAHYHRLIEQSSSSIDLISFPLDGPNPNVHDLMRSAPGNFTRVMQAIQRARDLRLNMKINTVVSRVNYHNVRDMKGLITDISPKFWNLYQYWPLVTSEVTAKLHEITDQCYLEAVSFIPDDMASINVEIAGIGARQGHYFFVSHLGEVYTHDSRSNYRIIGSLFDEDIISRWQIYAGDTVRAAAIARYTARNQRWP